MADASAPPPRLEELVDFPAQFTFRALGAAEDDFSARCAAAVTRALGRMAETVTSQPSAGGRYLAVRVAVTVLTPAEIYAVYAALREVQGVRMVL